MERPHTKLPRKLAAWVQVSLAILLCILVLLCLGSVETHGILGVVGVTSLGSSLYIMLSMPNCRAAHPKRMIGSYVVGLLIGLIFYYLSSQVVTFLGSNSEQVVYVLTGGLALATTMLVMVLADLHHPPAVGISLGVILEPWNIWALVMILVCVVILVVIKWLLGAWLRNLRFGTHY